MIKQFLKVLQVYLNEQSFNQNKVAIVPVNLFVNKIYVNSWSLLSYGPTAPTVSESESESKLWDFLYHFSINS